MHKQSTRARLQTMTAKDLAISEFPFLSGDIAADTNTIIDELAVGTFVIERGMARLYLIWKTKGFLKLLTKEIRCSTCGLELSDAGQVGAICPRCQSKVVEKDVPMFPTLEDYLSHIADKTGKSRQTLFNRLKVYRVLAEERGVNPALVFELNLMSSGAASKLASANDDTPYLELENGSWSDTVEVALSQDSKGGALAYVKYDVLKEPKISVDGNTDGSFTVYREYLEDGDEPEYIVEQFSIKATGEWPDEMMSWLYKKLGAKA